MKIKFDDPFRINLDQGEEVTISVLGSAGVFDAIDYSLDGAVLVQGASTTETHTFRADKPRKLGIIVSYSEESGGHFTLQIAGSKGGDVHTRKFSQSSGESIRQIVFHCDIEGNPTTHW